jgi:RNA 3'-terminal phosphate cyclase (ATP)
VHTKLHRWGFYPAGGGEFTVEVAPVDRLAPLNLTDPPRERTRTATAAVAALPRVIAERELGVIRDLLGLDRRDTRVLEVDASPGPGNCCWIEGAADGVHDVATGFGQKGVSAETVAERACVEHATWWDAGVPVGEHLADQLLVPLALAGAGAFHTTTPSLHATTNMDVIAHFLPARFATDALGEGRFAIRVA